MKIYTRTGDSGETSFFDGTRVSKTDPRIDAYGDIDELNAWIGFARALPAGAAHAEALRLTTATLVAIQRDLFALGAQLADPTDKIAARVVKAVLDDAAVERLETAIDQLEGDLPPLQHFILAGGVQMAAALHVARTVCRRAERRLVALRPPVDAVLLRYVNRLSDLLFVMARAVNHKAGERETEW